MSRSELDHLPSRFSRLFPPDSLPWGMQVDGGWAHLLENLCACIDAVLASEPAAQFEARQIKEKFGRLRFYYSLERATTEAQDEIVRLVQEASEASGRTCERCGSPAITVDYHGWLTTLCSRCQSMSRA